MTPHSLIYKLHFPRDVVTEPSTSGTLHFVDLINESFAIPEIIEKICECCEENRLHARTTSLLPYKSLDTSKNSPEIVVQIMRYYSAGRKLRKKVDLPSGLFALRGQHVLYYMKYIAMHLGNDRHNGHYIAFERPSSVQAAQRASRRIDEMENQSRDTGFKSASKLFNKWTKYEDNKKVEDQSLSEIEASYGQDSYICRLVPARAQDLVHLDDLMNVDDLITEVSETVVLYCKGFKGPVSEALDCMTETTSEAIAASLRTMIHNIMQLSFPKVIPDSVLLEQLTKRLNRAPPTIGRRNQHLEIFLDTWFMEEWKAHIETGKIMDTPVAIRAHAQRVLKRMFNVEGTASLISSIIRALVDGSTGRLENYSRQRLQEMVHEKVEEEHQQLQLQLQQQHQLRDILAALEADNATKKKATKDAQSDCDDDDNQDFQIQATIQSSLSGAGGTSQISTSSEALSAQNNALQEKIEKLEKQISDLQATASAMKGEKSLRPDNKMPPPTQPSTFKDKSTPASGPATPPGQSQ